MKSSSIGSFPFLKTASFIGASRLWCTASASGRCEPLSLRGTRGLPARGAEEQNSTHRGGGAGLRVLFCLFIFCWFVPSAGEAAASVARGSAPRRGSQGCQPCAEKCGHPPSAPGSASAAADTRRRRKGQIKILPAPWDGVPSPMSAPLRRCTRSLRSFLSLSSSFSFLYFFFLSYTSLKEIPSRISILRFSSRVCITTAWQPPSLTLR